MPTKKVQRLAARDNETIFRAIWNDASQEYQHRIPNGDQGDITEGFNTLWRGEFRPQLNEFVDALINRVGDVIYKSKTWKNPISPFKRGMMYYGDTIEEIATTILKAKRFDPNNCYEDVFKCNPPDLEAAFHRINRQDRYDLSITQPMMKRAFLDNYGFEQLLNNVMNTPYTSDEYDEYLIMRNLFAELAAQNALYKVQVPDVTAAGTLAEREENARAVTEAVRARVGRLAFLSGNFNPGGVPTFSKPDELVLFATPEFIAALDVNVIAFAFNRSAADLNTRIIAVDDFGIDGCQAILADENIFVCADTLISFESIYNPKGLAWNYFLHHHGVYSMSRFVNVIMFTTEAGSTVTVPAIKTTGVTVSIAPVDGVVPTYAELGGKLRMQAKVVGNVTPVVPGYDVPQAVAWTITGTEGTPLKTGTYIDAEGVLHVAATEANTHVTVTATSVYIDPTVPIADQVYQTGSLIVGIGAAFVPPTPGEDTKTQSGDVVVKSASTKKSA